MKYKSTNKSRKRRSALKIKDDNLKQEAAKHLEALKAAGVPDVKQILRSYNGFVRIPIEGGYKFIKQ